MLDIAARLRLPVLLVVGVRLGCLNHALLSALAIRARGLTFAGWVANRIDPAMAAPTTTSRRCRELPARCVAQIAFGAPPPLPRDVVEALNLVRCRRFPAAPIHASIAMSLLRVG